MAGDLIASERRESVVRAAADLTTPRSEPPPLLLQRRLFDPLHRLISPMRMSGTRIRSVPTTTLGAP